MQETWIQFLGQEDPLEKEMATHSSILAWETLWREKPGGLQSMGLQRVGHNLVTKQQQIPLTLLLSFLRTARNEELLEARSSKSRLHQGSL